MASIISNKISDIVTYFQRKHAENEEIIRMARDWTNAPIYCVRHPQVVKYRDIRKAALHLPEAACYTCDECEREAWLAQPLRVDLPGQFAAAMSQALRSTKHSTDEIEIPKITNNDVPQLPFPEAPLVVVRDNTPRDENPDLFYGDISLEVTHKLTPDEYDEITAKRPRATDPGHMARIKETVEIPAIGAEVILDFIRRTTVHERTTDENERIERVEAVANDDTWLR